MNTVSKTAVKVYCYHQQGLYKIYEYWIALTFHFTGEGGIPWYNLMAHQLPQ